MDDQRRDRLWHRVIGRIGSTRDERWATAVCVVVVGEVGVDAAAISLRSTSRAQELVGASDEWATRLEELQYTVGEGPGVTAFGTGNPVLVPDLAVEDARWPGFTDVACAVGAGAAFALPLRVGATSLGTLDLYRRGRGELTAEALVDAAVLAELAVTALLVDIERVDPTEEALVERAGLLGHYDEVNVATGMLAARLGIGMDEAFVRLRAHAFRHDRPLLEVARDVLGNRLRFDPQN